MFVIAKIYNDVIVIINILTTIIYCFIKGFSDNARFFMKAYYKNVFIKDVIIIKLFCNEDDEDVMIVRLSYSEGVCDGVIFVSYFCIKFIALFKYLTLYHISYFES